MYLSQFAYFNYYYAEDIVNLFLFFKLVSNYVNNSIYSDYKWIANFEYFVEKL